MFRSGARAAGNGRTAEGLRRSACRIAFAGAALIGLPACGGGGRTPLVVYSPHGRDLLELAERSFEARHPHVDVRWLDMGSQEVLDRLRSERANPQADVWLGGPNTIFARGAADSLLQPFRPSWADHVNPSSHGPNDLYFGLYLTPVVIAYNTEAITPDHTPRDWDDVLDPRFRGRVLIRDPLASGTMRAIFGMVLDQSLKETGDTVQGMTWLRRLDGQTREYVLNPALLHEKLMRREGWVTLWDLPDIQLQQRQGRPVDWVFPASGTPVIDDAVGVVRGADQSALAEEFVEWIGSTPMQLLAMRQAFRLPARTDLPPDSLADWAREVLAELRAAPIDWAVVAREGNAWMTYWDRHVRGKGSTGR